MVSPAAHCKIIVARFLVLSDFSLSPGVAARVWSVASSSGARKIGAVLLLN